MTIKRFFITVEGIVQGVGFRPFVYNLALSNKLYGGLTTIQKVFT